MKRQLFFVMASLLLLGNVRADVTGIGGVIVTPSLVGIDYSVTPGKARVTLELYAKSDAGNPAAISSYTFGMSMGSAPGSSVSATTGTAFFNATNFPGDSIGPASASFSGGIYTFSGDKAGGGLALASTPELVGTAVYDITQSATAATYNVTLPTLAATNGPSINSVTGASVPLVLNINGFSGGSVGGGGGGGASVPEPGSVVAISAVLGGLAIRSLRRRRSAKSV
jgi:hypothetical protein